MNISMLIIGIGALAFFIVPVILIHRAQKNKSKNFIINFKKKAAKQNINIDECEAWSLIYCIGIDTNSGKLFYLKKEDDGDNTEEINLKDVEKCRLANVNRTIKTHNGKSTFIERVSLAFTFKNSTQPEKNIEFFNTNDNISLTNEVPLAESWESKINKYLASIR